MTTTPTPDGGHGANVDALAAALALVNGRVRTMPADRVLAAFLAPLVKVLARTPEHEPAPLPGGVLAPLAIEVERWREAARDEHTAAIRGESFDMVLHRLGLGTVTTETPTW